MAGTGAAGPVDAGAPPRSRIIDAVFRLVERGGVAEASLRKVAEESGINIGSVRHYFGNAEGLMAAAAEEVGARMERRLGVALPRDGTEPGDVAARRGLVEAVCRAVLPIADDDRAELIVLSELIIAARLRPEFRALATRMGGDLRDVLRQVLEMARVPDPDAEAERLTALVGGLTFELVYPHGSADPDAATRVLRRHIEHLVPM
jgi:AcrR family transcriptional regulator